jgi:glutathione S-transferase
MLAVVIITANGRIPAIVDRTKGPDGKPQNRRVFEGASLLLYLTARYDPHHKISYPYDSDDYWEMVNFLAWQHGGIGPMQVSFLTPLSSPFLPPKLFISFGHQCTELLGDEK